MQPRATVAVVGLGGIGGIVAGSLQAAGRCDVIACARRPVDRIRVERPEGDIDVPLRTLVDPAQAQPVDWVLLCTKAHETPSAAPWMARLCGPATRVAPFQNGIEPLERVQPFVDGATVVPTIVYYNAERFSPDHVRLRHAGPHDVAVTDDEDGRALADLLAGTPLNVLRTDDIVTLSWKKLLMNVTVNPITALTLQRQAVMRRDDVRALCLALLDEAIAVGRACGAKLSTADAQQTLSALGGYPPEAGTSMYFDRLAGRPFEVDALTGALVAAGERHGVPTPLNRAMLTLLRAISDAAAEQHGGCGRPPRG